MLRSIFTSLPALFTVSLITTTTNVVVRSTPVEYIVGGSQASPNEFPYFVDMNGCGGALIAPDTVLFAAHCGDSTGKQIVVGAYEKGTLNYNARERFCDEWVPHPGFDPVTYNNDFALCKLDEPIDIDHEEDSVRLVWNDDPAIPADHEDLIVMGLGATAYNNSSSPDFLHSVTVPAISNDRCNATEMYDGIITDEMLCAGFEEGGKDSCQGDSGGPIVRRITQNDGSTVDYHVGVVSFGMECALANKPGVYARTSTARDFIEQTACGTFDSTASFCDENSHDGGETPPSMTCEAELEIVVETDAYGSETNWTITAQHTETELFRRRYMLSHYLNTQKVCVEKNTCYNFTISDVYGDGLCAEGSDCGMYELRMSDQPQPFASGAAFGFSETASFCVDQEGRKVDELELAVLEDETGSDSDSSDDEDDVDCKDERDFEFQGGRGCGFVSRKRYGKGKRLCKKGVRRNKQVHDHCRKTCGEFGIGRCKHLKKPKRANRRR